MLELKPMNKYLWIEPLSEDEKIAGGLLYAPGNAREKQYRLAKVLAKDDCEEASQLSVGDTVLYDAVGMVTHRVGDKSLSTVRALNVLAIVREAQEKVVRFDDICRVLEVEKPAPPAPFIRDVDDELEVSDEDVMLRMKKMISAPSPLFPRPELAGTIEYQSPLPQEVEAVGIAEKATAGPADEKEAVTLDPYNLVPWEKVIV